METSQTQPSCSCWCVKIKEADKLTEWSLMNHSFHISSQLADRGYSLQTSKAVLFRWQHFITNTFSLSTNKLEGNMLIYLKALVVNGPSSYCSCVLRTTRSSAAWVSLLSRNWIFLSPLEKLGLRLPSSDEVLHEFYVFRVALKP